MIKGIKRLEVEEEIRLQVDDLMREELKNLKAALERDKGAKKAKKSSKSAKKKTGGNPLDKFSHLFYC